MRMTLQKIAIGTAENVMNSFCHSGRLDRNAIAAATEMKVISDRRPAHASATFNVRTCWSMPAAMKIFVAPLDEASTPLNTNVWTATFAASTCSGQATLL